jgi:osmotically-inducible protein OsmY
MKYLARTLAIATLLGATLLSAGCFPLAATGLVVGSIALTDRRTLGAQTEDTMIEFKAGRRISEQMRYPGGISVTSFNRRVLLTGQVANEADKRRAEQLVREVDNVRQIHNELQVAGQPGLTSAAADATITAAVKAALVEAKEVPAASIKVVTESGIVYLLGVVTQLESQAAVRVASRARGVQKVVAVFEVITDEELKRISTRAG